MPLWKRYVCVLVAVAALSMAIPAAALANSTSSGNSLGSPLVSPSGTSLTRSSASELEHVEQTVKTQKVYRLYNLWSGEHFYTASPSERASLVRKLWLYEGIAWTVPVTSQTPVFRMLDKRSGAHFYTASTEERDNLEKAGWKDEGVCWYSDDSKTVPVYRCCNPASGAAGHVFTASKAERKQLGKAGWKGEGVGWYARAQGRSVAPSYKRAHWAKLLSMARTSGGIAVSNGTMSARQRARVAACTWKYPSLAYIALNVKTGKVVSHNADRRTFSASTMKAPYIAALCKYNAHGVVGLRSKMYDVITYSDNQKYNELYARYGQSYLRRLAHVSGVDLDLKYATCYADVTPRELAMLWTTICDYLKRGGTNVSLFKKLFGMGSYYKEGWMENGTWCGQMYHVAGVEGDCVYAIMTRTSRPNANVWRLRNALAAAVK